MAIATRRRTILALEGLAGVHARAAGDFDQRVLHDRAERILSPSSRAYLEGLAREDDDPLIRNTELAELARGYPAPAPERSRLIAIRCFRFKFIIGIARMASDPHSAHCSKYAPSGPISISKKVRRFREAQRGHCSVTGAFSFQKAGVLGERIFDTIERDQSSGLVRVAMVGEPIHQRPQLFEVGFQVVSNFVILLTRAKLSDDQFVPTDHIGRLGRFRSRLNFHAPACHCDQRNQSFAQMHSDCLEIDRLDRALQRSAACAWRRITSLKGNSCFWLAPADRVNTRAESPMWNESV